MIITDTTEAFLKAKDESGKSWSEIATFCQMTVPNTIQAVKRKQFNHKYVLAAQALGYDIEVHFVPHSRKEIEELNDLKCRSASLYGKNCYEDINRRNR